MLKYNNVVYIVLKKVKCVCVLFFLMNIRFATCSGVGFKGTSICNSC